MENFRKQLQDIHDAIALVRLNQRNTTPHKNIELGNLPSDYPIKETTASVLQEFDTLVTADTSRYQQTMPPEETPEDQPEDQEEVDTEIAKPQSEKPSDYSKDFKNDFTFEAIDSIDATAISIPGALKNLGRPEKHLCMIIAKEIEFIASNLAELGYTINAMNKLKKVYTSICANNTMDAVTILRTACKEDPNNRSLPFILSQVYYYLASLGRTEMLPKANKKGSQSSAFIEKFSRSKLLTYRYTHAASVISHTPDQALQLIRDYALLNPEGIIFEEGITANKGIHLKSFILLSRIPTDLWGNAEIEALLDLITKTVSGALIYIYFIRPKIIADINSENDSIFHRLTTVEKSLQKALYFYNYTIEPLTSGATAASKMPWTTLNHYQSHFSKVAPTPSFDEVLMYISLDSNKYYLDTYPSELIKKSPIKDCAYWYAWANTISPYANGILKDYIPFAKISQELPIIKLFEKLVSSLEKEERSLTPQDKWGIIKPYMPHYAYSSFIEVGTKGQLSSGIKNASDPYFKAIFAPWFEASLMTAPLPSQIIRAKAMSGTFTTLEEIATAFKGIAVIIADPVHGLKTRSKQALKKCLTDKHNLKKGDSTSLQDEIFKRHFRDFWWLYFILIPFSIITFFILLIADNYLQAMKMLSIIMIVIISLALIAYHFFKASTKTDREKKKK